jgi:hypothetical protein
MKRLLRPGLLLAAALFAAPAYAQKPAATGGCPPQGDATKPKEQALNVLKAYRGGNRRRRGRHGGHGGPARARRRHPALDLGHGRRDHRLVLDARDGGPASSNCHSSNPADHDTILDLSPDANVFDAGHRIVAVITPQGRRVMAANGVDWSTNAIQAAYTRHYVKIVGWLLFDTAAAGRSLNSAALEKNGITRATAWEIHPVTSIELDTDSLEQQQLAPSTESP